MRSRSAWLKAVAVVVAVASLTINFGLRPDRSLGISRGLNAKMSELHAATALAVLDNFDEIVQRRRRAAAYLRSHSGPNVGWQRGCERSTWQFVPVAFGDADARVRAQRASAGRFEVRTYYQPLHRMDPYRSLAATGNLARTEDLCERILCLPMANDLSDAELQRIVAALAPDHAVV